MKKVQAFFTKNNPKKQRTFFDDFNRDILDELIKIDVYFRAPQRSPFDNGNWVIDLYTKDDCIICIKLSQNMTEKQLMLYLHPLNKELREDIINIQVKDYELYRI